jgi:hypothetical protein
MKTCLQCYNLFDRDTDLIPGSPCPILKCCGRVIEIDDNILHTITQLNQKGYSTAYCCAGHTWGNNPFIVFDCIVYPDAFPYLPKDFKSEIIHDDTLRIFKTIPPCSMVDNQRYLMEASVDLMVWSESLPSAVELVADFELIDETYLSAFNNALLQRLNTEASFFPKENDKANSALFTTLLSPTNVKVLEKKIECFANEEGVPVSVDIFE